VGVYVESIVAHGEIEPKEKDAIYEAYGEGGQLEDFLPGVGDVG